MKDDHLLIKPKKEAIVIPRTLNIQLNFGHMVNIPSEIKLTEMCLKCGFFNSLDDKLEKYRCHGGFSCPAIVLSQEFRDHVCKNLDNVEEI